MTRPLENDLAEATFGQGVANWFNKVGEDIATKLPKAYERTLNTKTSGLTGPLAYLPMLANNFVGDSLALAGQMQPSTGAALGGAGAGIFAGKRAKTADMGKLVEAEVMAHKGASPEDIRAMTGWFKGPEGGWRFEIDDSGAKQLQNSWDEIHNAKPAKLSEVISHPELFAAYPHVKNIPFQLQDAAYAERLGRPWVREGAMYGKRVIPGREPEVFLGVGDLNWINRGSKSPTRRLLHELQHAVQHHEDFPTGGSPFSVSKTHNPEFIDEYMRLGRQPLPFEEWAQIVGATRGNFADAQASYQQYLKNINIVPDPNTMLGRELQRRSSYNVYRRLSGEVEARDTQHRMHLNPIERFLTPPYTSEGITRQQMITRGQKGLDE